MTTRNIIPKKKIGFEGGKTGAALILFQYAVIPP